MKVRCSAVEDLSPVLECHNVECYGRQENFRVFAVEEEPAEDILADVVIEAENVLVPNTAIYVLKFQHLPNGPTKILKPSMAKFV